MRHDLRTAARAGSPRSNWTAWTHFLKLMHVAKIGMKPCEIESHRLRTNSSHMQPCFSGSLPCCAGRAPAHAPYALSYGAAHRPRSPMHTRPSATPPMRAHSRAAARVSSSSMMLACVSVGRTKAPFSTASTRMNFKPQAPCAFLSFASSSPSPAWHAAQWRP